jgi:hypothetical protein
MGEECNYFGELKPGRRNKQPRGEMPSALALNEFPPALCTIVFALLVTMAVRKPR